MALYKERLELKMPPLGLKQTVILADNKEHSPVAKGALLLDEYNLLYRIPKTTKPDATFMVINGSRLDTLYEELDDCGRSAHTTIRCLQRKK